MQISHTKKLGETAVALAGELDHHQARETTDRIRDIIGIELPAVMKLDMSGVGFMDSSGIAVVMQTYKELAAIGSRLEIVGIQPQSMRVLKAAGINKIISIK